MSILGSASRFSPSSFRLRFLAVVVWILLFCLTIALWPLGLEPESHPLLFLSLVASSLGLLAIAADLLCAASRAPVRFFLLFRRREDPNRSTRSCAEKRIHLVPYVNGVCAVIGLIAAVNFLWHVRPFVGGVDFFYFTCYARDMLQAPLDVSPRAYSYFPGVYAFWRTIISMTGVSLDRLQFAHIAVVATVGFLVGTIAARSSRSICAGAWAAIAYLVFASRFEGFAGTAEPLACIPFLAAVSYWNGRELRGRRGYLDACVLGVGIGLAIYVKQQAGLLALGWLALIAERIAARERKCHSLIPLIVVPLAAATALIFAILLEGKALAPLFRGLYLTANYPVQGNWLTNIWVQVRNDESATITALFAIGATGWWIILRQVRGRGLNQWQRSAEFLLIAGIATLAQFRTRPYGHYALLGLPCLVAAVVPLMVWVGRALNFRSGRSEIVGAIALVCAWFPLAYTGKNPNNLHIWRLTPPRFERMQLWCDEPKVTADLKQMVDEIKNDSGPLYVLPPYRAEVFFLSGRRPPVELGYSFIIPMADKFPWSNTSEILIVHESADTHPQRASLYQPAIDVLQRELPKRGYRTQLSLSTMTLYVRAQDHAPD